MQQWSYKQRAEKMAHPLAKRLLTLMADKQTNLALAADVTQAAQLLHLAEQLGPEICVLKTHIDILEDYSEELTLELQQLANKHQFLLFEDRKFADIGNTVFHQYSGGMYKIADWADLINAHSLPGQGILDGLKKIGLPKQRACLLLAEMSGEQTLFTPEYAQATVAMAEKNNEFVIGFIAQQRLLASPDFIYMTPGVNLSPAQDNFKQTYHTPHSVIEKNGSDIIIVGRAIIDAIDPIATARTFRELGWAAYEQRISNHTNQLS